MDCKNHFVNTVESIENFSFAKYTTYGCGGNAKIAYFPKTEEEAIAVYDYLIKRKEKFIVLGNGSDILAADNGFDGCVISTKKLQGITLDNGLLRCLSGTTVTNLLQYCKNNGLSGLEYLVGIPATVGGLALMNGGVNERHIESNVVKLRCFDGKIHDFDNKTCNFGNKHSTMRDINALILSVCLDFKQTSPQTVKENIDRYLSFRSCQPAGKSCGCVFKNPEGKSAGKLIDDAGLKGLKIGGAEVSRAHANFIINNGEKSSDVYALIKEVKRRVFDFCGVKLEEEVVYIGEFNDFDS